MNFKDSLKRRIDSILSEIKSRGFEAVVFINEYRDRNTSNFVYVAGPRALGDEHSTLVFDVWGDSTCVIRHWWAKTLEESGIYSSVIPVKQEKSHHMRATKEALSKYDKDKICFDLSTMCAQFAFKLGKVLDISLIPDRDISDHVLKLRTIKDEYEISEMKRALSITEEAVIEMVRETRPGMHTWELKKRLEGTMIEKGAIGFSVGGNSSLKFVRGPSRPYGIIKHGDMLSIDVGCRVDTGYCSDMGRTWPITMDADAKDFLERSVTVQVEGIKNIKEGVSGNEVLKKANELNAELGFEPALRCGHQIGLDCHDYTMPFAPNFGPIETDAQPLKAGMTLSFEPTRIDSKLKMRSHIEDMVLVTKGDPIILNTLPWNINW